MVISPRPDCRWIVKQHDPELATRIGNEHGLPPLVSRLLVNRGIVDSGAIEAFLNPSLDNLHDPKLLPDYDEAVKQILSARELGHKIFIHGDYDVDGVTSTALFSRFLSKIGCDIISHVPHRMKEGYGIHISVVDRAHEQGAKLFLTCDCGASAIEQIIRAKELGMNVVVTDHHLLKENLPPADAIVNPHRSDSIYPYPNLSGVGVVFKLCAGITAELGHSLDHYYRAYLDLATLGTVADIMPLTGENRIIVANGLERVQLSQKPGLRALISKINLKGKLTTRNIGFNLGPRLNAAGRIDDAALSLKLMLATEDDVAMEIADQLEALNNERRSEQERVVAEAMEMVGASEDFDLPLVILAKEGWHEGLVGLMAGNLVKEYYRPAFVARIMDGEAKGSARSIPGFHLADALNRVGHLLNSHGGHELAAGFSMDIENFDEFKRLLLEDAAKVLSPELLVRTLTIDAETTIRETNLDSLAQLARLEPYGQANPEPLFLARGVKLSHTMPMKDPSHVRAVLSDGRKNIVTGVGFGIAPLFEGISPGDTVSVVFTTEIDTYGGKESAKWMIKDVMKES